MSKNTNLSFLTDYITADITNGRIGINNASPTVAFDVTGAAKFSSSVTSGDLITASYGTARIQITSTTNSANAALRYTAKDSTGTSKNAGIYYVAGTTTANTFISLSSDDNAYLFNVLANGNVGIGTSSTYSDTGFTSVYIGGSTGGQFIMGNSTGGGSNRYLQLSASSTSVDFQVLANAPLTFWTNTTERMRITAAGNVGIGTSSPGSQLVLAQNNPNSSAQTYLTFRNTATGYGSWAIWKADDNNLGFYYGVNSDTPSAGINMKLKYNGITEFTSRVLVNGEVWGTEYLGVVIPSSATAGTGVTAYSNSSSYTGSLIRVQSETAPGTGWYGYELRSAGGTLRYGIYGNGTVTAPSDERRKKNIETTRDGYLQDVCNLRVVKYNWKDDEEGKDKELGFVAQEVEKVFPKLVETGYDGMNNENEVKLLKQVVLIPILVKAIQELKAEIETLKNK